eukprot:CAMPEP_0206825990 /NCGR_PEP_ID=MMETSP0975-20121206/14622_1 /ASSEMBLY_ACC=CAM_ASM_000399 /TAXON_ID=483370 /ORGANISM="non described non described, Strain CCMP2097" /LENGTH=77 /DNA_ID=CAMNT_0054368289 /DNA_START=297 /DNA_END=526 /DNA_ORIENTATION=+
MPRAAAPVVAFSSSYTASASKSLRRKSERLLRWGAGPRRFGSTDSSQKSPAHFVDWDVPILRPASAGARAAKVEAFV